MRKAASSKALRQVREGCTLMAVAFGVYAVFGGLVIVPIFGIPPQFVRMLCAVLAGYASFGLLHVLEIGLGKHGRGAGRQNADLE
jgi:ABC-type Mn2+/Zn2+ transport system permease subunit